MHDDRDRSRRIRTLGSRVIRSARRRVMAVVPGGGPSDQDYSADSQAEEVGAESAPPRAVAPADTVASIRREQSQAVKDLRALTAERDQLRRDRLDVQQLLGEQHGKRVMPRLKVEKTNGTPSFVVAQRMMQRVHRRALDPYAGLDGVGAVFAQDNPAGTAAFAASHGVPVGPGAGDADYVNSQAPDAQKVLVHAFKGKVGLVEVRGPGGVRHFDSGGQDPGAIRPAATYDPTIELPSAFADICTWADVLSAHIPRPYVQLLFTSSGEASFLEHIEVDPDRIPVLTTDWDERLGSMFDYAYSRFLLQPYRTGGLDNRVPGGTFSYEDAR